MGLWQLLTAGYDANSELSRVDAGGLYPLSSTTISNQSNSLVILTLGLDGDFRDKGIVPKRNDKRGVPLRTFPIPVTQESLNRTNGAWKYPHPLFDFREFVFPEWENGTIKETKKNGEYKKLLQEFAESSFAPAFVKAVCRYVSDSTRNFEADFPEGTKPKTPILFRVEEPGVANSNLWEKPELFSAWHMFYTRKIKAESGQTLDFIGGEQDIVVQFHPKKIFLAAGNAKLVSANDKSNFVFRGIFRHPENCPKVGQAAFKKRFGLTDAVTIGYESSQKAHQFLRYLIVTHGIHCGEQVIVPFANRTGATSLPPPPVADDDEDWGDDELTTTADVMTELGAHTGLDYAKSLGKALVGFTPDRLVEAHAPTAIAIFESATPGRLSVTYYRELARDEYLENIQRWHEACKWPIWRKLKETDKPFVVFGAPSFERILQASFGWPKSTTDSGYQKLKQRVRAQLIRSVFDNAPLPDDFVSNAVHRVSNPLSVTTDGQFDRNRFLATLATTCALLKHEITNPKESFDMNIDLARTDRDYLYGRLLGAADKLEEYALHKKDNSRLITAAIRYMQTFSMRPATTWQIIHNQLIPYKQQVRNSVADRELQSIGSLLAVEAYEDDRPLAPVYLAGYYHERAHIETLIADAKAKKQSNDSSDTVNQTQEN